MSRTIIDPSLIPSAFQNSPNLLANGGFEIWRRGTTFTATTASAQLSGQYFTDNWFVGSDSFPAYTVSQESTIVDSGIYSAKVNFTTVNGATGWNARQIFDFTPYRGKTVTLSMRIRSNVTGVKISINDGITITHSSSHSGGSTFETLTVTKVIASNAVSGLVYFGFVDQAPVISTFYADSAIMVIGSTAVSFVPSIVDVSQINGTALTDTQSNQANIIDNGGFEIWQRGTSFTNPVNGTYTADRWFVGVSATTPTYTVTRESSTIDSGTYALKINVTANAGNAGLTLQHFVEDFKAYRGKTVTLSIRINASATNQCFLGMSDGINPYAYTYVPATSGYQTFTLTLAVASNATQLWFYWGNSGPAIPVGTYYFDSAMMVVGPTAVPFVPTNPEVALARCQRYFFRIAGNAAGEVISTGHCQNTTLCYSSFRYPVVMRTAPTITIVGGTNFYVYNASGSAVATTTVSTSVPTVQSAYLVPTVASGLVAGNASLFASNATTSYIDLSSDL